VDQVRLNILFVVPYTPNIIRVRSYNLIRHLSKLGHRVSVFTLFTNEAERNDIDILRRECHEVIAVPMSRWRSWMNCVAALPDDIPLQSVYSWSPELASRLVEKVAIESQPIIDIIHVEHLRGSRYGLFLKERNTYQPVVWDSVDCISYLFAQAASRSRSLFGRWITQYELSRTRKYEGSVPAKFDRVLITSEKDKSVLMDLAGNEGKNASVSVLANGVDLPHFQGGEPVEKDPSLIVFSGKMSYHANITMALFLGNEVMPLVWQSRPDARLIIVGKDPPGSIRALARHPAITVTGTVEDMRPYIRNAAVAAVPMIYGAGVQNKLLEAMACGTPVVATPLAILDWDVQPGIDLLVAEDAVTFANNIVSLLGNPGYQKEIGEAGKLFVEKHHSWMQIAKQLEGIYYEVIHT